MPKTAFVRKCLKDVDLLRMHANDNAQVIVRPVLKVILQEG